MKICCSTWLLLVAFAGANCLHAGEELTPKFGFGSPEVIKLDWSTRSLTPADFNADGLTDIAVINNDAGKIELLYQFPQGEGGPERKKTVQRSRWEPVLEDALFEKQALTIGFPVFDLAAHDLNADGLVDLAYTSGEVPLTVRYQSRGGEWVDSKEYDGFQALGWTNSIKIADINRDGLAELFVLSSDAVRVFRQTPEGGLGEPELLYISGENPFNIMLLDATGDGLLDLLYLSTDGKQILAMREQIEGGQFGPESRHVLDRPARIVVPLRAGGTETPSLGVVDSRSGAIEFLSYVHRENEALEGQSILHRGSPDIYPIFKKVRESASYALGDVDGNGEEDLVVANPANAALVLFAKSKGGFRASEEFPSFSAVSSLTAGRFHEEKAKSLIVLSEGEKTMGRSTLDSNGRLTFPRQIKTGQGDPVVLTAADVNRDQYDELLLVYEEEGSYRLRVASPVDRKVEDGPWEVLFELELEGVRRKPTAIKSLDLFTSGKPGLMVFVPREPPVLLRPVDSDQGMAFETVAAESSIRESLLKALSPAEVSVFDVDADGTNELVVAKTGFARAFRVVGEQLEMVDQFNARRGTDVIHAVIPLKSGSEINGIALYLGEAGELQFLRRDETGVFRYERSQSVGRLELQNWYHLPALNGGGETYLLAGEDRFWYFGETGRDRSWEVENIYETDLEDIHYTHLAAADFDRDGELELVAVDGSEHVLDVLSRQEDQKFRSVMYWQVFEQNMHYQGRTGAKLEPRQILIDEFTGDGLLDLTLLVHDRILIYPQE